MLRITVPGTEVYDEETSLFQTEGDVVLELEHSLVSLSKWEARFEKPFLDTTDRTTEENLGYVEAMIVDPDTSPDVLHNLSEENMEAITAYIEGKQTATWFHEVQTAPKTREKITSELIYYWMTVFNIPFECEHWHLNRLFTLIRICNIKQSKPKKMSRSERAAQQRELNAKRREQLKTSG